MYSTNNAVLDFKFSVELLINQNVSERKTEKERCKDMWPGSPSGGQSNKPQKFSASEAVRSYSWPFAAGSGTQTLA